MSAPGGRRSRAAMSVRAWPCDARAVARSEAAAGDAEIAGQRGQAGDRRARPASRSRPCTSSCRRARSWRASSPRSGARARRCARASNAGDGRRPRRRVRADVRGERVEPDGVIARRTRRRAAARRRSRASSPSASAASVPGPDRSASRRTAPAASVSRTSMVDDVRAAARAAARGGAPVFGWLARLAPQSTMRSRVRAHVLLRVGLEDAGEARARRRRGPSRSSSGSTTGSRRDWRSAAAAPRRPACRSCWRRGRGPLHDSDGLAARRPASAAMRSSASSQVARCHVSAARRATERHREGAADCR